MNPKAGVAISLSMVYLFVGLAALNIWVWHSGGWAALDGFAAGLWLSVCAMEFAR